MKRHAHLLLLILFALPLAATAQESTNIGVIPTPQQVVMGEGTLRARDIQPRQRRVDAIAGAENQQQAYRLEITRKGVTIHCVTAAGWQYGRLTLQQLQEIYPDGIPCMTITDWPAYTWRGWMDDISRGPIPNAAFRQRTRAFADQLKMNYGSYYTEHTLYNEQLPDISALSGLHVGDYADDPYMMANLQCFAHFEKTLRIPYYQHIMDGSANVDPSQEATYDFLRKQISNTLRAYSASHYINISCDETEGLGSGRARNYVDSIGADEAYCRHINRVYDIIQDEYRRCHGADRRINVLMWGDIVGKNPAMLKRLPREMQYIIWSYVAKESYADMIAPFKQIHDEQGNAFWVASGTSHWSSTPQVRNYMQNIAYLARDGHRAGALGYMNTAWDDSGESLFGDCWHAVAWAAEMAWNPIRSTDPAAARREMAERERQFNDNYDSWLQRRTTGPRQSVTTMIYAVGDLCHDRWVGDWFNTGALMQPLTEFYPANVSDEMLVRCDSVTARIDRVLEGLDSSLVPHFYYACHRIRCVAEKSRLRVLLHRSLQAPTEATLRPARQQADSYFALLHRLKLEYLRLWDEECTDYSRDIICDRYDRLGREVQEAFYHVDIQSEPAADGTPSVRLRAADPSQPIHYTLDGRTPSEGSPQYDGPFALQRSGLVRTLILDPWNGRHENEKYLLLHKGMGHIAHLGSRYSDYNVTYSGGGDNALADGVLGSDGSYRDGHWQGYWGEDIDVRYDFGQKQPVNSISMRFLQNTFDWVLAPETIELYTSTDGQHWELAHTAHFAPDFREAGHRLRTDTLRDLGLTTRHLRVVVRNPGVLPPWHPAPGQPSYLFLDEIVID